MYYIFWYCWLLLLLLLLYNYNNIFIIIIIENGINVFLNVKPTCIQCFKLAVSLSFIDIYMCH